MQKAGISSLRRAAESEHFYSHISIYLLGNSKPQAGKNHPHIFIKLSSLGSILWHFFGQCKPGVKLDDIKLITISYGQNGKMKQGLFGLKYKIRQLRFPYIKGLVFKRFNSQNQYRSSVTHFNTTFLEHVSNTCFPGVQIGHYSNHSLNLLIL